MTEVWIYGNARMTEEKADGFFVRVCSSGLQEYKEKLLSLSKQLLEGMSRDSQEECWMAGYLDERKQVYMIAVAGNQEHLLNMKLSCRENRGFFCVMAYGLPREAIALYERNSEMFEPLKETMRRINQKMADNCFEKAALRLKPYQMCERPLDERFKNFEGWNTERAENSEHIKNVRNTEKAEKTKETEEAERQTKPVNLLRSTEENDDAVWAAGLHHLVVTGIGSELAAKRILERFPSAIVTVRGNRMKEMYYQAPKKQEVVYKTADRNSCRIVAYKEINGNNGNEMLGKIRKLPGRAVNAASTANKTEKERKQQRTCSSYKNTIKMCSEEIDRAEMKKIAKFENQEFRYFCYLYCWMHEADERKTGKQSRNQNKKQDEKQNERQNERQNESQDKRQEERRDEKQSEKQAWILLRCAIEGVTGETYSFQNKKWNDWNNWNRVQKEWKKWVDNKRETAQELNRRLVYQIECRRAEGRM